MRNPFRMNPNGMAPTPQPRWAEEEALLPLDLEDQALWQESAEEKPIMPGGTLDWRPTEAGALGRLPDESAGPLPILANAAALGYVSPGELAALDRRPRRITTFFLGETQWEDYDVDGRRIVPPFPIHPAGVMSPNGSSVSVNGGTPGPVTAILYPATVGGTESEFLAAIAAGDQ